ncbi:DNA internalization-related competence protein ComEC/Rec2 [Candidatus Sumerlaeota bacterium]|nr:DNA internalization-related competence protein ComEC/Rec2 [Candidatus Sumerlaeota bacterium]
MRLFRVLDSIGGFIRGNLHDALDRQQANLALALLIGDREGITPRENQAFMRTGLMHILSVSGLHTAFILGLALAVARFLWLPPRWCGVIGILILIFYTLLTGLQPPVVRAAIMGAFILIAWMLGRAGSVLAALATSAFLTLAYDPKNLDRADWQLSYLCVMSLALFASPVYELLAPSRKAAPPDDTIERFGWRIKRAATAYLWLPFAVTFSVQIGLLPVQLALFHQFSLAGLIIQPFAVQLTYLIMLGSLGIALIGWIGPLGSLLGALTGFFVSIFTDSIDWVSERAWSSIPMAPLPPASIGIYYAALILGPHTLPGMLPLQHLSRPQKKHLLGRLGAIAAFLVWIAAGRGTSGQGHLNFYVVDVGQGDGLVMQFPNGSVGIVDGGREMTRSGVEPPMARFLRSIQVHYIDFVVATHADADHIGGLISVVENYDVGMFIRGPDKSDSGDYARLEQDLIERRIPVLQIRAGDHIANTAGVSIEAINPEEDQDNNDASVVLLVAYGKIKIVLTGDISRAAEDRILSRGFACDVDVLKVAHHGSGGSSSDEFLDAFKPEIALISVGKNNVYHHPNEAALRRLEAHRATVLRTDELGTVLLRTDGRRMQILHYNGSP